MKLSFFLSSCFLSIVVLGIWGVDSIAFEEQLNRVKNEPNYSSGNEDNSETGKEVKLKGIPKQINKIARKITVRIDNDSGNGSGVIFARNGNKYYVLTAKHVVEKDQIYNIVTNKDESYEIKPEDIIKFNDSDLAIVAFDSDKQYEIAAFSDYTLGLNKEFWVFVYGWAKSSAEPQAKLTVGKVVGKETGIFLVKDDLSFSQKNGYELVYTNLSQRGMSGGPVLDTRGRVIGIHTSAEGERYRLTNKLQLGFSLGIPIATFLDSEALKTLSLDSNLEINTIKERPDIVPFAQRTLSQKDLNSIPPNLLESPNDNSGETEWVNYGNQLWRVSRYLDAVTAFDKAIAKKTNFYQAYYGKGLALYELGNYQDASHAFQQAIELEANFYPAWYRQSLCLLNLKQYSEALTVIERAIALKPENIALYALRGEALQNMAQYDEAINSYNKAIAIDNNPLMMTRRGSIYRLLEKYDLALNDLNEAIKYDPKYTKSYINRGLVYYQLGNYQKALANFNHVIILNPQDLVAYLARGFVHQQLGEKTQALVDFNKAFQIYSNETENNPENNDIKIITNNYQQVATDFYNIAQLNLEEGNIYLGQGLIHLLLENKQQAIDHLAKASDFFKVEEDNFSYQLTEKLIAQIQQ